MGILQKEYELILSDPPWHFRNWSGDPSGKVLHQRTRGANKHYITQWIDEICQTVPPSGKDALLLMWAISSHLEDAFKVIDAWGFEYKTVAWVWVKTRNDGTGIRFGGGYYTRQCTEMCLLATKKKGKTPKRATMGEPAILFAPRQPKHSGKPAEQYAKINRVWPDLTTKLEMYARQPYDISWDVWGNQSKESIVLPNNDQVFIDMPEAAK